jgi:hypothetical protein
MVPVMAGYGTSSNPSNTLDVSMNNPAYNI